MDNDLDFLPLVLAILIALVPLSGCGPAPYKIDPITLHAAYTPCPAPARPALTELSPASHLGGPVNAGRGRSNLDRLLFYIDALESALGCYQSQAETSNPNPSEQ